MNDELENALSEFLSWYAKKPPQNGSKWGHKQLRLADALTVAWLQNKRNTS